LEDGGVRPQRCRWVEAHGDAGIGALQAAIDNLAHHQPRNLDARLFHQAGRVMKQRPQLITLARADEPFVHELEAEEAEQRDPHRGSSHFEGCRAVSHGCPSAAAGVSADISRKARTAGWGERKMAAALPLATMRPSSSIEMRSEMRKVE